jgi:hypothetical protein
MKCVLKLLIILVIPNTSLPVTGLHRVTVAADSSLFLSLSQVLHKD